VQRRSDIAFIVFNSVEIEKLTEFIARREPLVMFLLALARDPVTEIDEGSYNQIMIVIWEGGKNPFGHVL